MTSMPAVFLGHGNPMNTLEHNVYTDAWHELGQSLPRPRAVLSISAHWDLASLLAPLRDDGVLVLGSDNIVHNLGRITWGSNQPADWNVRFDEHVRDALDAGDRHTLAHYLDHPDGALACPSPDHYLPALYVAAPRTADEPISTIVSGYDVGSLSMRSFRVG